MTLQRISFAIVAIVMAIALWGWNHEHNLRVKRDIQLLWVADYITDTEDVIARFNHEEDWNDVVSDLQERTEGSYAIVRDAEHAVNKS